MIHFEVHLKHGHVRLNACKFFPPWYKPHTADPRKVTCKNCKRTIAFEDALAEVTS